MPTSLFLARLIGPILVAAGLGALINQRVYRTLAEEFLRSYALIYLSGLLSMTAGLAIVLAHNVWTADWRVIITLLGWLGTIGGAARIAAPERVETIGRAMLRRPLAFRIGPGLMSALGVVLCFFGYFR